MNKILFFSLIFACSILPMTAGSGPDKNDGATLPPMFLLGTNNGMMQMVYWCDFEEPQYIGVTLKSPSWTRTMPITMKKRIRHGPHKSSFAAMSPSTPN